MLKPLPPLQPGETVVFHQNPYYDEVLLFHGLRVPTAQDKYKRVEIEGKVYYELREKTNAFSFRQEVQAKLLAKKKSWWPYKEPLLLTIDVMGPTKVYNHTDLDNIAKGVCDALKTIVFEDDSQIIWLHLHKQLIDVQGVPDLMGMDIGIRRMADGELPEGIIYLFGNQKWNGESRLHSEYPSEKTFDIYE